MSGEDADVFDAFGLRDDASDSKPGLHPFDSDDFAPAQVDVTRIGTAQISNVSKSDGDADSFFDPFATNSGDAAPRGFKRSSPVQSPQSSPKASNINPLRKSPVLISADEEHEQQNSSPSQFANFSNMDSASATGMAALPPRLGITFFIHEEVTSQALESGRGDSKEDMACQTTIEGEVHCLLQSSDAMHDVPFQLRLRKNADGDATTFNVNKVFVDDNYRVSIPRTSIGKVPITTYTTNAELDDMPILVQSKISLREGRAIHVAVQVRSNLSNTSDLEDFTVAVPVPSFIDGSTIEIHKGEGTYDELKRVIKWRREMLPRGESFLVGFQSKAANNITSIRTRVVPVLLRCISKKDKIGTVEIDAAATDERPASVHVTQRCSFRLLHRTSCS